MKKRSFLSPLALSLAALLGGQMSRTPEGRIRRDSRSPVLCDLSEALCTVPVAP